jgi:7,8-dihydroneopterin aldolase/epimerase/oxygenase
VIVEIHGLEVFGHHGAGAEERRRGQTFLFDVTLDVREPAADELDATVDYRAVRDTIRDMSETQVHKLLESLAAAAAEAIVARFDIHSVSVRVRKPGISWAEWTAATASRPPTS